MFSVEGGQWYLRIYLPAPKVRTVHISTYSTSKFSMEGTKEDKSNLEVYRQGAIGSICPLSVSQTPIVNFSLF